MKVTKSSKYTYSRKDPGENEQPGKSGRIRALLIIICYINIFLYYAAYAYFESILTALARFELPVGFLTFLKYFIIFVLGFLIGFLIVLGTRLKVHSSYFDIRVFLLVGLIPALAIILSYSGAVNFLIDNYFSGNETVSELYYYFFSRADLWGLWLGIATGASIRLKLIQEKRRYKHQAID